MNRLDKEEFTELILKYQISMYRLAMGILKNETDAEDVVSNAILSAYEHISSLKNRNKFKAWVMTIVANEAKTWLRKQKRVDLYGEMSRFEGVTGEENKDIWKLVLTLDEEFSKVVILYYYEGFTTKEIAKILHISDGTVKSRLSRARDKLKKLI